MTRRADFRTGVRDVAPMLLGEAPFGVVVGVTAASVGLTLVQAVAMSLFVFTGAAQLAAVDLLGGDTPVPVVVLAALVVNLRYVMFSAGLAPYVHRFAARWRWPMGYLVTDPVFALSVTRFRDRPETDRRWYYLGVALPMWVTFQAGTVAGVLVGAKLPPAWHLDFAVPLLFIATLVPAVEDRSALATAVTAGAVAVAGAGLPFESGLVVGALVGVLVGILVEEVGA